MSKIFVYAAVGASLVGWIAVVHIAVHLGPSIPQQDKALYQQFAIPGTLASPTTIQEHQDENR